MEHLLDEELFLAGLRDFAEAPMQAAIHRHGIITVLATDEGKHFIVCGNRAFLHSIIHQEEAIADIFCIVSLLVRRLRFRKRLEKGKNGDCIADIVSHDGCSFREAEKRALLL